MAAGEECLYSRAALRPSLATLGIHALRKFQGSVVEPGPGQLRRRPSGMRIGNLQASRLTVEVIDDAPEDGGVFATGDDLDLAATSLAGFDIDVEYALQAAYPRHGGALGAVRGENTVVTDEVDAGFGNERSETGAEVQRL